MTSKITVACARCRHSLFPLLLGACPTCGIRPSERLVTPNEHGQAGDGWEWRLGRDGVRRAVWLNGNKA